MKASAIAMKKAHEIRNDTAHEMECRPSEIHFGTCLKMAWAIVKKYGAKVFSMISEIIASERCPYNYQMSAVRVDNTICDGGELTQSQIRGLERAYDAI